MRIGVILLNWNRPEDTLACIKSLKRGMRAPDHILVWDNGSEGDDVFRIRTAHPDVEVISSPVNLGFAEANNRAAGMLLRRGMEAIWILNNDTEVSSNGLEDMCRALDSNQTLSAVTAKIVYEHPAGILWYAGGRVNRITLDAVHEGIGQPDAAYKSEDHVVDFISGCCMLIRSDVLRRIGLFNGSYFAYYEDLDWSLRVVGSGGKLMYVAKATLVHKVSSSVRRNDGARGRCSPLQHYLQTRNHLYVIRTHADGALHLLVSGSVTIARRMVFAIMNLCMLRWDKVNAVFKGIRDGLGRMPDSGETVS